MDLTKDLFRKNLKTLRKKAGLKQHEAAEIVDVDLRTYQRWEQGKTSPSDEKKRDIANAFKSSVADLYREDGKSEISLGESKASLLTSLYSVAPTLPEDKLREVVDLALRYSR